jgi:hypothetical protein
MRGEVGAIEVVTLPRGRVDGRVEQVGRRPVIVGGPLVEVVGDVERCRVGRGVFKIDDDNLEVENEG